LTPGAYRGGVRLNHTDIIGFINVTEKTDVLRLHELSRRRGMDPHELNRKGGFDAHLDAVLSGRDDSCREGLRQVLVECEMHPLDLASARLLIHAGIDPVTACALALLVDGPVSFERDWDNDVVVNAPEGLGDQECFVAMTFGHDVSWNSQHGIRIGSLPVALASAAHGRLLRHYVSHPVLDELALTLGGTSEHYGHDWISVDTPERVDIPTLLTMRPHA
jgi:hypothetical protein